MGKPCAELKGEKINQFNFSIGSQQNTYQAKILHQFKNWKYKNEQDIICSVNLKNKKTDKFSKESWYFFGKGKAAL